MLHNHIKDQCCILTVPCILGNGSQILRMIHYQKVLCIILKIVLVWTQLIIEDLFLLEDLFHLNFLVMMHKEICSLDQNSSIQ